ncbi:MAG: hypothetical protein GY862_12040 [Gammaproteobacteria bacterium]|nr:hypothetical protein [Gammaproteobacteria bacterium]
MTGGMMGFGAVKSGGSPKYTGAPLPILRPGLRLLEPDTPDKLQVQLEDYTLLEISSPE